MFRRISCFCIAIFFLFLSSCAEENLPATGETENLGGVPSETFTESETTTDIGDNLPDDLDFEGAEFNILSRAHIRSADDFTVEEAVGEVVNDAIYNRQKAVEERLNVKIVNVQLEESNGHGPGATISRLVKAGDDVYDIFSGSSYITAPLGLSGNFYNLYDINHIDLSQPYWMQGYIENSRIGNALYTVSGDIMLSSIRSSFAVFFNKTLLAGYELEDPYQLVRDGKWTIDKQAEMVKNIYRDLNGNGERDETDFYGMGTSNVIIIDAYTSSFDMKNMLFDENHYPYLNTDVNKFAAATEKLYDLNWNQQGVFSYKEINDNNEMTDLCDYFSQGNLIFINNRLRGTETSYLRNMESDYGILPYPKYDENQENYYTFLHDQFGAIGIPVTVKDTDMVGAVLEALAAESRKSVVPAYYDIALKAKYTRDNESAVMLDIIHNGVMLDMSWIYGDMMLGLPQIMRNLLLAGKTEYVSTFEKNAAKYEKVIGKMIAQIEQ